MKQEKKKVSEICQNFLRELFVENVRGGDSNRAISENLIYLQLKAAEWE